MGRVYLPKASFDAAGYSEQLLSAGVENEAFRELMQTEVDRAESFLRAGAPLTRFVPKWLSLDVAMFIEGGLAILREIRRADYRVISDRPTVSKGRQLWLVARCWTRQKLGTLSGAAS
jgi:phytoene/squalene synthetase